MSISDTRIAALRKWAHTVSSDDSVAANARLVYREISEALDELLLTRKVNSPSVEHDRREWMRTLDWLEEGQRLAERQMTA
jgi:hypothetical protein